MDSFEWIDFSIYLSYWLSTDGSNDTQESNILCIKYVTIIYLYLLSNECVKGHLEQYFEQSCHVSGKDVHQLSLLCIQCFEVSNNT